MERSRSADLQIIQNFLDCLRSPSGLHADQDALNLSSNPLCADLFSSVIGRIDKHPVEHVADLEKKVIAILTKLSAVASGLDSEGDSCHPDSGARGQDRSAGAWAARFAKFGPRLRIEALAGMIENGARTARARHERQEPEGASLGQDERQDWRARLQGGARLRGSAFGGHGHAGSRRGVPMAQGFQAARHRQAARAVGKKRATSSNAHLGKTAKAA